MTSKQINTSVKDLQKVLDRVEKALGTDNALYMSLEQAQTLLLESACEQ